VLRCPGPFFAIKPPCRIYDCRTVTHADMDIKTKVLCVSGRERLYDRFNRQTIIHT
jgi:hypothetical protein